MLLLHNKGKEKTNKDETNNKTNFLVSLFCQQVLQHVPTVSDNQFSQTGSDES